MASCLDDNQRRPGRNRHALEEQVILLTQRILHIISNVGGARYIRMRIIEER